MHMMNQCIQTALTGINTVAYFACPLLVPPLPEQCAIATALSDVDALLVGLDRLIAKKRDLKQAAMQQLLTGQIRLPGFHGEWDVASLDMLTSRATGVWGKNVPDERNSRLVEIIRAGDISQDGRLSDMDAELAARVARRDKTRDLKQAMMQELLTGKTRLVPVGAAHA